jgi:type II secretory pathway pseudopilin PulG
MDRERLLARQLLGSILVALTIVAIVIVIVVAKLGTGTGENRNDDSGGGKDTIERTTDDGGG